MCLRVYNELLTWYEAHNYCSKLGYSLALIENFELEKKMNKILYDNDDFLIKSLFGLQNQTVSSVFSKNLKNFWTGIRHLNATDWFDSKNNLLNLRQDEKKWWPWLIVDSKTYSQGSCVAKKRDWFFLEDCYKRMPFACQTNKQINNDMTKQNKQPNIEFKCGNSASFSTLTQTSSTKKSSTNTPKNNLHTFNDAIIVQNYIYKDKHAEIYSSSSTKSSTSNFNINQLLFIKNTTSLSKYEKKEQASEINLALFNAKKSVPQADAGDNANTTDSSEFFLWT
jgi:hypothetical protein